MPFDVISNITFEQVRNIAQIAGPTIILGGLAYTGYKAFTNWLYNRAFDQFVVSVTTVSEPDADGYRWLILDNLERPERFDDAVRGNDVRKTMIRLAKLCTWEPTRRFLLSADEVVQIDILHAVRNAISGFWREGLTAMISGAPYTESTLFFAVTGGDTAHGAKNKFRVIVMRPEDLDAVLEHPRDMWKFTDQTHTVRFETCRLMALSWRKAGAKRHWRDQTHPTSAGTVDVGGRTISIVGWIRTYTPRTA